MTDVDFDVIAFDENMDVIFGWQGNPGAERLEDLASDGLARMAIAQAHLIRRRDGWVLKSRDESIPLGAPGQEQPNRLERVELIPPAEELVEHEPLPMSRLVPIALWKALMASDEDGVVVEDRDILTSLEHGYISIEHLKEGVMIFRAHAGPVSMHAVSEVNDDE